jgi:hypothetical protein
LGKTGLERIPKAKRRIGILIVAPQRLLNEGIPMLEEIGSKLSTCAREFMQCCKVDVTGDQRYYTEVVLDVLIVFRWGRKV